MIHEQGPEGIPLLIADVGGGTAVSELYFPSSPYLRGSQREPRASQCVTLRAHEELVLTADLQL